MYDIVDATSGTVIASFTSPDIVVTFLAGLTQWEALFAGIAVRVTRDEGERIYRGRALEAHLARATTDAAARRAEWPSC